MVLDNCPELTKQQEGRKRAVDAHAEEGVTSRAAAMEELRLHEVWMFALGECLRLMELPSWKQLFDRGICNVTCINVLTLGLSLSC